MSNARFDGQGRRDTIEIERVSFPPKELARLEWDAVVSPPTCRDERVVEDRPRDALH